MISSFLEILDLQPRNSKVFLDHKTIFLTVGQNNFGNKIPECWKEKKQAAMYCCCAVPQRWRQIPSSLPGDIITSSWKKVFKLSKETIFVQKIYKIQWRVNLKLLTRYQKQKRWKNRQKFWDNFTKFRLFFLSNTSLEKQNIRHHVYLWIIKNLAVIKSSYNWLSPVELLLVWPGKTKKMCESQIGCVVGWLNWTSLPHHVQFCAREKWMRKYAIGFFAS